MYSDNSSKFAAVLNQRQPLAVQLNALGHLTAGLASQLPPDTADYLAYPCPAGRFEARLSRFPYIVLSAKNSNQIQSAVDAAAAAGVAHNAFTTSMLGSSASEQQAQTQAVSDDDLDYVAVVLFGHASALGPITKRFSVFKDPTPRNAP